MPLPDLPRYDRSKETPLQATLRAAATGILIGSILMSVVLTNFWIALIGVLAFVLIAVVGGLIEAVQESRSDRR